MNKIQNTLGAVALSLGIATSTACSQDISKVVNTTSNAVVAATTSNSGNAGKITPKIDISALVFPKDVKLLLDEAKKYGVEVKDGIKDEKEFGSLQDKLQKKIDLDFEEALKVNVEELKFPKDVEKMSKLLEIFEIDYKVNPERRGTFIIASKKVSNFILDYEIVERAKIRARIAKIQAKRAKVRERIDSKVLEIIRLAEEAKKKE